MTANMILITGNTYPVKEQLKALGARWNGEAKGWMVPADKAGVARQLVSSAPKQAWSGPARSRSGGSSFGRRCYCSECHEPYRRGQRCWETGRLCTPEFE